jgi:aspartyl-tRNA(Asn)/glutamyl-tRNA(Gln) amidotransferase subunit C
MSISPVFFQDVIIQSLMAKLTREDILKLARLSRLKLNDDEIKLFQREISDILNYIDLLKDVDVTGLKPTSQVTGLVNVTRADEVKGYGVDQKALLKNVPMTENNYLKVNRMVG